jgi:hypothetical protein
VAAHRAAPSERGSLNDASCVRAVRSLARGKVEPAHHSRVRDRHLAAHRIGNTHHRGFAHAGLLGEQFFDFARIDVEAAGDDQVAASPCSVM